MGTSSADLGQESDLHARFLAVSTPRDVADLLDIPYDRLVYLAYKKPAEERYTEFQIPKKTDGTRTIAAPCRSLKLVQRRLNRVFQAIYRPKPASHGFVLGRSIVTNASRHKRQRYVLNVDLQGFFPSINEGRIWGLFRAKPYELESNVAKLIARLCCHNNALPQGAPTSPVLSNMVCRRLDRELLKLAQEHRCIYTRYADDLTFSTSMPTFPEALAGSRGGRAVRVGESLALVIQSNGFEVNEKKVRLQRPDQRQEVTGLTTNKFVNVSRRLLRQVRAMLHAWRKFGLEAAQSEYLAKYRRKHRALGRPDPSFREVVLGKINFVRMVRGEDDPYFRLFRDEAISCDPDAAALLGSGGSEAVADRGASGPAALGPSARPTAVVPPKPLVLLEGETDVTYVRTALELLDRKYLLDALRIDWLGRSSPRGAEGGGSGGLKKWLETHRHKPELWEAPTLLLYDCDAKQKPGEFGQIWVRRIPRNESNTRVPDGIENLLPTELFTDGFYRKKAELRGDGGVMTIKALDKARLCAHVCEDRRDPSDFEGFRCVVELLEEFRKFFHS